MLKALNEDAIQTGVSHHVQTHQSDWGTLALTTQYDIVIASMTPAINNVQKIEKILGASKQRGIYVDWEKYRINKRIEALRIHSKKRNTRLKKQKSMLTNSLVEKSSPLMMPSSNLSSSSTCKTIKAS